MISHKVIVHSLLSSLTLWTPSGYKPNLWSHISFVKKKRGFQLGQFKICFNLWNVYSLWLCLPNTNVVFLSTDFSRVVYSLFFNYGPLNCFVRVTSLVAYSIHLSFSLCISVLVNIIKTPYICLYFVPELLCILLKHWMRLICQFVKKSMLSIINKL